LQIDEDAVRGMSDSDLSEYLPKKGDRFALKDFITVGLAKPKSRKAGLMDRLRDRLRSNRANSTDTCTDEPESTVKKIPKLSAKKQVHKVHLGWYHFEEKKTIFSACKIRVITKLPNSEQSYKEKFKSHKYINRQNQSTIGKL
jgi:hypothetical protein